MTAAEVPEIQYQPCPKCGDFGFTGSIPVSIDGHWLARDVFEFGIPCSCAAGEEFRDMQAEWSQEPSP